MLTAVRPPLVYIYQVGIGQQYFGRGAAGAVILTAVILIITVFQVRLFGLGGGNRS